MERLEKLTLTINEGATLDMLTAQLPNSLRILELTYNCDEQATLIQFINLRGQQFEALCLSSPLILNQRTLLYAISAHCLNVRKLHLGKNCNAKFSADKTWSSGLLPSIPFIIKHDENPAFQVSASNRSQSA